MKTSFNKLSLFLAQKKLYKKNSCCEMPKHTEMYRRDHCGRFLSNERFNSR
jgi:hypothetical protein